jgi:hypothetical protein
MKTLAPNGANHDRNRAVQLIFNNLKRWLTSVGSTYCKKKGPPKLTVGRAISDYLFFYYLCLISKIVICSDISINFYFRYQRKKILNIFFFFIGNILRRQHLEFFFKKFCKITWLVESHFIGNFGNRHSTSFQ